MVYFGYSHVLFKFEDVKFVYKLIMNIHINRL